MTIEAALAACSDAGLAPAEVDGAIKYTYDASIGTFALLANLGSQELAVAVEVPFGGGSCAALVDVACAAVESGKARAVLCWRTVSGDDWIKQLVTPDPLRPYYMDTVNYLRPVGWTGYLGIFAAFYSEYIGRYEMPREALFEAVNLMRANAARNGRAVEREQVDRDAYFNAPLTVGPFTEFDEFALADTSCALLVTTEDLARDSARPSVEIVASAQSHGPDPRAYFDSRPMTSNEDSPASWVARELYATAKMEPSDIDLGLMYDCTSFTLLYLAEHYGLCAPGESAARLAAGDFSPDGSIPLNPHGGDLAGGYTHGFRQILEAVRQLRGEADNQIARAEVALIGGPPAGPTSGLVLRRGETRQ